MKHCRHIDNCSGCLLKDTCDDAFIESPVKPTVPTKLQLAQNVHNSLKMCQLELRKTNPDHETLKKLIWDAVHSNIVVTAFVRDITRKQDTAEEYGTPNIPNANGWKYQQMPHIASHTPDEFRQQYLDPWRAGTGAVPADYLLPTCDANGNIIDEECTLSPEGAQASEDRPYKCLFNIPCVDCEFADACVESGHVNVTK